MSIHRRRSLQHALVVATVTLLTEGRHAAGESGWTTVAADPAGDVGKNCNLILDENGSAHTLDEVGLGLDAFGRAHVVYYDGGPGDLMYAVSDGATAVPPSTSGSDLRIAVWPNPTARGSISFELAPDFSGRGRLQLHDVSGREIRSFSIATTRGVAEVLRWDGTDRTGTPVPAGVYFVRAHVGSASTTRKFIVLG